MTRASNAGTLDRNFVLPALCGTSDDADVSHNRRAGPLARGRGDGIVPAPWVACALTQHEFRATVGGPLVANKRSLGHDRGTSGVAPATDIPVPISAPLTIQAGHPRVLWRRTTGR